MNAAADAALTAAKVQFPISVSVVGSADVLVIWGLTSQNQL